MILAEEAALEAERLEAERLELREREEALARFAAQREEAQALLALQEEREAKAADSGPHPHAEPPAGDLPGDGSDGSDDAERAALDDRWPEEIMDLEPPVSLVDADELPAPLLEPLVPDDAVADLDEEPAWGVAVLPEPQPQPEHASDVAEGERTAEPVSATGTDPEPEPALVPPGAAAHGGGDGAGLDLAVDEGGDLRPVPLDQVDQVDQDDDEARRPLMAGDLESGLGQDRYVPAPDEGQAEPLSVWPAARTELASDDVELEEEAEDAPEAERDAEPAPAAAEPGAVGQPVGEPDRSDEPEEAWATPAPQTSWAPPEWRPEAEPPSPEVEVGSADAATGPAESPSVSSGRSRITTGAFDDAPPADLGEGDGEEAPAPAALKRQRRSGQPRVPLKARRLPADAADAAPPTEPTEPTEPAEAAEPAMTAGDLPAAVDPVQPGPPEAEPVPTVPTAATVTKAAKAAKAAKAGKTTKAAKTGGTPSSAAAKAAVPPATKTSPPATKVAKAVSVSKKATPAAGAAAPATTAKAPSAKKISSRRQKQGVLWVEPVGGSCPTSYPVKASLSSGIFHVVGGLFYERTRPDRCYRDEAAATADGLRQAKR